MENLGSKRNGTTEHHAHDVATQGQCGVRESVGVGVGYL
jgi:hypothetical protein